MINCQPDLRGKLRFARAGARCLMVSIVCLASGCSRIQIERFKSATRADARVTPGTRSHEEPFATAYKRLRSVEPAVCADPDYMREIVAVIVADENKWLERWGMFLDSPALSVTFYDKDRFLGRIKIYESALGHAGNLQRSVEPDQTARLLELIYQCAQFGSPDRPQSST